MLKLKRLRYHVSPLASVLLLAGCGEPSQQPVGARVPQMERNSVPSVAEITRYYAGLMAHETCFADFNRRPFADFVLAVAPDSASFTLSLPNCVLSGRLDMLQRLEDIYVESRALPLKTGQPLDLSHAPAARLTRLSELRRAFGPGKVEKPSITKEVSTSLFTVSFRYHPAKTTRSVTIEANMRVLPTYADTTRVAFISVFPLE